MPNNASKIRITSSSVSPSVPQQTSPTDFKQAAIEWFGFGFNVLPLVSGTKTPAVGWDAWLKDLSPTKINQHWSRFPKHELACIVGNGFIAFDADTPESTAALIALENEHQLIPQLVVNTAKGIHHYFKLGAGVYADPVSFDSKSNPSCIDIKTGRSAITLPPSTGKSIQTQLVDHASKLSVATQAFVDAVFIHNGKEVPRPNLSVPTELTDTGGINLPKVKALLEHIDSDCGYDDWVHVLMAIHHESDGSEEGFKLANQWSSNGSKYSGENSIRLRWNGFKTDSDRHFTIGTLINMVNAQGLDAISIMSAAEEPFEICHTETTEIIAPENKQLRSSTPFDKYSLLGRTAELQKYASERVPVLNDIALRGEATVIYAAPNTGKTLITLWLLMASTRKGKIDPSRVYYLNVDDTSNGLVEKNNFAEESGFHMLTEGHRNFKAKFFLDHIEEMTKADIAKNTVVILDTLKKFVNLMDKNKTSYFNSIIRPFLAKGGTVIALAHVNKRKGDDGRSIHSGTTDIIDDFDCAHMLDVISVDQNTGEKVVEFRNIKQRGKVALSAAYSYIHARDISYAEMLSSVQEVSDVKAVALRRIEEIKSDLEVIEAITHCIQEGITAKMMLAEAVAEKLAFSKRHAIRIIEKYTGTDPVLHKWQYSIGNRGANLFTLLDAPQPSDSSGSTST